MVGNAAPGRVEIDPARLIVQEGVVVVAVPELDHGVDEVLGPLIAARVQQVRLFAEVLRLGLGVRGHEIPAGAPAADEVERGELPREVVGLVKGGRDGPDQPDPGCDRRETREQRQRLEESRTRDTVAGRGIGVTDGERVVEKEKVEARGLRLSGDVGVGGEIRTQVRLGLRVPPRRHVMTGRHQESPEFQ